MRETIVVDVYATADSVIVETEDGALKLTTQAAYDLSKRLFHAGGESLSKRRAQDEKAGHEP